MGGFGSRYFKIHPTKYLTNDPVTRSKFNRHQDKNYIINHAVDKILLQENNKVSAEAEANEKIESELNKNDLYQIDNMSIDDNK